MISKDEWKLQQRIKAFKEERNRILLHGKPEDLVMFLKRHNCPVPTDHYTLLMTWHKAITAVLSLPLEYRQRSKDWLTERGLHSLDDGDLTA